MRTLAGDVGGTKTILRISGSGEPFERRFESGAYESFSALLDTFLKEAGVELDSACFAVAGPVIESRAEVTNLGWTITTEQLAHFPIKRLSLINDFHAVALGVPLLKDADLYSINRGTRVVDAPIGILGAGTGLGEAAIIFDCGVWNVIASEGGHGDFAPQDEEQAKLFVSLQREYGHVSWERVLSGMGLLNIYNFLTGVDRPYDEDLPAEISRLAGDGDTVALQTFAMFADVYGSEAGNMALRFLARGGVFLAGGVAAKNAAYLTDGRFLDAFLRKGRFRDMLMEVPVDIIMNERVGLIGAEEMARRLTK